MTAIWKQLGLASSSWAGIALSSGSLPISPRNAVRRNRWMVARLCLRGESQFTHFVFIHLQARPSRKVVRTGPDGPCHAQTVEVRSPASDRYPYSPITHQWPLPSRLKPWKLRTANDRGATPLVSSYRRPADFCWAFFCRRGRRDLFFGGSFPFFTDFVDGVAPASEASPPKTVAAGSFLSAISFRFAK